MSPIHGGNDSCHINPPIIIKSKLRTEGSGRLGMVMEIAFLRVAERANIRAFRLSVQSPFAAPQIYQVSLALN